MDIPTQETQTANILSLTPATKALIVEPVHTWGRLYSTYLHLEPVDLQVSSYKLGRAQNCEIVVTEDKVPIHRIAAISKVHFEIFKEDSLVYIKDLSKNGTFLNGNIIGKGKINILQNDDEIAIGFPGLKVYIFKVVSSVDDNSYLPLGLRKKYQVSRILGQGACGEVKLVFEKATLRPYAVKKIKKSLSFSGKPRLNDPLKIAREINILKALEHPCVIGLLDFEETADSVFIVLEYMEGGELTGLICTTRPIRELDAKPIFYQIALGVKYLHSQGIIHRDLKLENILLKACTPDSLVKISDFGLSRFLDEENDYHRTVCGTPRYAAPEVLNRQLYGYQADVWSLGVVLFYMLAHELPPFDGKTAERHMKHVFVSSMWERISDEAQDLVRSMLTLNPAERIRMEDVLRHPWLAGDECMIEWVQSKLYGERATCFPAASSDSPYDDDLSDLTDSPPAKRTRSE